MVCYIIKEGLISYNGEFVFIKGEFVFIISAKASKKPEVFDLKDYKTEIFNNRRDSDNPSSSPYFQEYEKIIKSVNGKMNNWMYPIEVANLVSKIIKEKKPKINYLVGGFLEKKITLKSLLPDKLFQRIIMKLYS